MEKANVQVTDSSVEAVSRVSTLPGTASQPEHRFKTPVQRNGYNLWKRGMDVSISGLLLLGLAPIMGAIALAIYLHDRGPVLYRSFRIGRGGRPFVIYKFRSMCLDADKKLQEVQAFNQHRDVIFKSKDDPRVTRIGRFLRKYSLDELPQLINVFKGNMSLVGPRPMLEHEVEKYNLDYFKRLHVKPGITCYWQIMGRSNLTFEEWMALDLKYLEEMGFWTDLKILAKTPIAVLRSDGAY